MQATCVDYETLVREVSQSITFLRCWSRDHELLSLKSVACALRNSFKSTSDARGNWLGRSSLYDFINAPKESDFSLLSLSKSGVLIAINNTTNYSLNQCVHKYFIGKFVCENIGISKFN